MSSLESWILEYLLNALWQVPLLFLAAWLATQILRSTHRIDAALEHRLWAVALVLEALVPACTFAPTELLRPLLRLLSTATDTHTGTGPQITIIMGPAYARGGFHPSAAVLHAVVLVYACTIAYFTVRLIWGLTSTAALARRAQPATLTGEPAEDWQNFSSSFGVDAELAISHEISSPMTIGIVRRMLLLPPDMLTAVTHEDLAAALAHEFAHIRRRDFAWNLVYQLLSLPIAFHPVLALARTRLVESREMICDTLAADAVAGRQRYARSLLRLASIITARTPTHTLHAIGIFDANNFERRVMNLTTNRIELRGVRRLATATLCGLLTFGACTSALALRLHITEPNPSVPLPAASPNPASATANLAPSLATIGEPIAPAAPKAVARLASPRPATPAIPPAEATDAISAIPATPSAPAIEPQAQDAGGPISISGGEVAGNRQAFVQPVYPAEAKAKRISGSVVLHALISKEGVITKLEAISGPDELRASAIDAVRQWTYRPYLVKGQPTEVDTTITVNYHISGGY